MYALLQTRSSSSDIDAGRSQQKRDVSEETDAHYSSSSPLFFSRPHGKRTVHCCREVSDGHDRLGQRTRLVSVVVSCLSFESTILRTTDENGLYPSLQRQALYNLYDVDTLIIFANAK